MAQPGTSPQTAMSALPTLKVSSLESPFSAELLAPLSEPLPEFVRSRRWFRAKARTISKVDIEDLVPFSNVDSALLVLRLAYQDGEEDRYLLPLSMAGSSEADGVTAPAFEPLAVLESSGERRVLYSALSNPKFRSALLDTIAEETSFSGRNGQFTARRVHAVTGSEPALDTNLESSVSRAEQSNTSVIYGQKYILKLFRKIEAGINPDIEIGAFLTEHGFQNTPAVLATLEYSSGDRVYAAGILQKFVPNKGDAWGYTIESLGEFFSRSLREENIPSGREEADRLLPTLIGDYSQSARLLGQRTAEMHQVLSSPTDSSDFTPEPFTEADGKKLQGEMLKQADLTFNLLRQKEPSLTGRAQEAARQLIALEDEVRQRFSTLADAKVGADRI